MKRSTIKLVAGAIFQFQAGAEVEVITTDAGVFYKVADSDGTEVKETAPTTARAEAPKEVEEEEEAPKSRRSASAEAKAEEPAKDENKIYTKDELFDMEVKELKTILKGLGVNPDDFDGRNTNKKLRDLVLDAQAGKLDNDVADDTQEEEEEAPKPSRRRGGEKKEKPADDLQEVDEDEWENLEEGSTALVRIVEDDELQEKLWEVEIIGWDTPKGSKDEEFFVKFLEDGTEDFLREGDKLYLANVDL